MNLAGCNFFKEAIGWDKSKPTAKLLAISLDQSRLPKLVLNVRFEIENPLPIELTFTQLTYDLKVNEELLATGSYEEMVAIAAHSSTEVVAPLAIDLQKSYSLLKIFLAGRSQPREALWHGSAKVNSPLGPFKLNFAGKKKL